MLNWINRFSIFAYLDNNQYTALYNRFELIVATDPLEVYTDLASLAGVAGREWLFGHLNYDLKNELYPQLSSRGEGYFQNYPIQFFKPGIVAYIPFGSSQLVLECADEAPEQVWRDMMAQPTSVPTQALPVLEFIPDFDQQHYTHTVRQVQHHITEGDCYELNLCVGAYAQTPALPTLQVFDRLNHLNPAPFACLYRQGQHWLMGSSPERFLYKEANRLVAQPMKGTIRRDPDPTADERLKAWLLADEKERAENIMIADLMRNDLAKHCQTGTVRAEELFGLQTFPTVHTMVSTVSGVLPDTVPALDALLSAFPMGSMTGAPKYIVMQLIEALEQSRRDLYSGTVGYFTPDGNFDFNVVIRSLLYDAGRGILSYHTGGAITIDSIPEKEWEEVRLKALALERLFRPEEARR